MEVFIMLLVLTALAGGIVFFILAFVKGKENRLRNFGISGGCLYAILVIAMIAGSTDGAFQTFLGILMVTALAGMMVFFVLAFVKGKGNRLGNFAKSGGCLYAILVIALIAESTNGVFQTFLEILMLTAIAGVMVFFVLAFVKGKDNRLRNFGISGGCLYAILVIAMIAGSTDGAFQTFFGILILTALAGVIVFFVLAFVKGKGNRLRNFAKSGGCLFALLVIALIAGSISEEAPVTEEVTAEASAEDKEAEEKANQEEKVKKAGEQAQKEQEEQKAEEQAKKEQEEQEAKEQAEKEQEEQEAEEQAQKEQEEQEAKEQAEKEQEEQEAEEQAQKEQEEQKAEEQAQKEQEEQEAKEQAQKEQEAKEAEEQAKKEEEEKARKEEEARKAKEASVTVSQKQAVSMAQEYLNYTAFSKSGLIDQLEFEGFNTEDATYGVENITVDWQEQAVVMAREYLDYTSFSRQGLIDQLTFEGFSTEHATYAASQVGF